MADPAARAVILLSGGLDSATAAAIAREQGFELYALTVDYGQRHVAEVQAAERLAQAFGARDWVRLQLDLRGISPSALTFAGDVPKGRTGEEMAAGIPATYVPARNTVLLALALAYAESRSAADIFLGVNAIDYSGYPDCRPEFLQAFERLAQLATKAGVEGALQFRLHAPLVQWSKAEIIRTGLRLGVDYSLTHSCYDPDTAGRACGRCDSCLLRLRGFSEAGVRDPALYQS